MAGRPKTRARKVALGEIPQAHAQAHDAPAPAPAPERGRVPSRIVEPPRLRIDAGPHTRAAADVSQADATQAFARQLAPGVGIRIERLQPKWAAGWLEDMALEGGDAGELYAYVQEEYGGRVYKVTILAAGGQPLYPAKLNVAGPVRHHGRVVSREQWEGDSGGVASTNATPAAGETGAMVQLLKMVLDTNKQAAEHQTAAMAAAMQSNTRQTQELMSLIVQERGEDSRAKTLAGQLEELEKSSRALQRAGRVFGAAKGRGDDDDGGMMGAAKKVATEHFLTAALGSLAKSPAPAPAPHGPRLVHPGGGDRPQKLAEIPMARPRKS